MMDRKGKFWLSEDLIKNGIVLRHRPLFKIFAKCIIVEATYHYADKAFEYTAISPEFDVVPERCQIPTYTWRVTMPSLEVEAVRSKREYPWVTAEVDWGLDE